jgi:TonB family protein
MTLSLASFSDASLVQTIESRQDPNLEGLTGLDRRVTLRYHNERLIRIYEELAQQAGFTVSYESATGPLGRISVAVTDTTVRDVLELLARDTDIEYRVIDAETLGIVFGAEPSAVIRRRSEQEQRAGAPEGPVKVGGDIEAPEKTHHVNPVYPDEAKREGLEGVVILEAVIDKEGNVKDVRALRSLEYGLTEAAEAAVKQWKYTPTYYNGEPVEVVLTITVMFQLGQ